MARHGLARPAASVSRREPPPHHRWSRDRLTGTLSLTLTIPEGQFVSPSTGRLTLGLLSSKEIVAQEAARAAQTPVIPGSGIKGAVRNLYELLSFSCDPFAWMDREHRRSHSVRCKASSCCDACSLFGILGRSGRVGFDDARPENAAAVQVEVREVPIPWGPQKPSGDVSLYDFQEATVYDRDRKAHVKCKKELAREVFLGTFETRLTFWNVTQEELGRLLLAMGIGVDDATRFHLRLGGVKYDGKGAVTVRPRKLALAVPQRKTMEGEDCVRQATEWMKAARSSEWAETFWPKLEEVARLLANQPAR